MFYLVCFDVVEDRARARVAKVLKEYGERVQKSVFECSGLTEKRFLKMKARVEKCIDATEDTVRYYFLCGHCLKRMEYEGIGSAPDVDRYRLI